jgi:hypothetical protein
MINSSNRDDFTLGVILKRPWSIGAVVVAAIYLVVALWTLLTSEIGFFIAALPWSYLVASGPWGPSTTVALFIPCVIVNAALIYLCVAPFLRITARTLSGGGDGRKDDT